MEAFLTDECTRYPLPRKGSLFCTRGGGENCHPVGRSPLKVYNNGGDFDTVKGIHSKFTKLCNIGGFMQFSWLWPASSDWPENAAFGPFWIELQAPQSSTNSNLLNLNPPVI